MIAIDTRKVLQPKPDENRVIASGSFPPAKMPRKEIRKKLRAKAKEVHYQDKLLAEWMNQLADKI
jgi:hypothetical protein